MNITFLSTLPIGHAVELTVAVPAGMLGWHVRRRLDAQFPADPLDMSDCTLIHAEERALPDFRMAATSLLDDADIQHGIPYYYQAYGYDGQRWTSSPVHTLTPQGRALVHSPDPLTLLRERLRVGLEDAVLAKQLRPATGRIPVLTAPPQADTTAWPLVTLHLETDTAAERYIGEQVDMDRRTLNGTWLETEGWLSRTDIRVIGWSQNPDERMALRLILKHLILGNLPVFAAHGLMTPDWSQQDSEDFQTYPAPVYQTVGSFSCLSAAALSAPAPSIATLTASSP